MENEFPGAVPEIPVSDVDVAGAYYKNHLGFSIDWGGEDWRDRRDLEGKLQDVPDQSCLSRRAR